MACESDEISISFDNDITICDMDWIRLTTNVGALIRVSSVYLIAISNSMDPNLVY